MEEVVVEGDVKAAFSVATSPRYRGGHYCGRRNNTIGIIATATALLFSTTLDTYLIMLSIIQGGIKYDFLCLWHDSTCDWILVSWVIGEHSTQVHGPSTLEVSKVKLATLVESDPKAPFSIATTPRYRGGRYLFPWIVPLYPRSLPYNAGC